MLHAPLGWLQLKQEKTRFAVALAGVAFAVVLILMQLGFQSALYKSSVRVHEVLDYGIALLSRESAYIAQPDPFSRRRLYQVLAVPGVASVEPFYAQLGLWKNPFDGTTRHIFVITEGGKSLSSRTRAPSTAMNLGGPAKAPPAR